MGFGKELMLSKSRFLAGYQCPLRLWHQYYNPQLASEASAAHQAMFDAGHEVGVLATHLFPGGRLVEKDYLHHGEAVESTKEAMRDPSSTALFEAAFVYDDVRIRADILKRTDDGRWHLIEVKSATSVKGVYVLDLAIQYYVLQGAGLDIASAGIMHINKGYRYDGKERAHSRGDLKQSGGPPQARRFEANAESTGSAAGHSLSFLHQSLFL